MNMNIYIRLLPGIWALSFILLLVGCTDPFAEGESPVKDKVAIKLNLNVPGSATQTAANTRVMPDADETHIDYDNLQVLVFEETTPGTEVFRYKATITQTNAPDISLYIPKSRNGEKYRFVLLANAPQVSTIADGTPKKDALEKFIVECKGIWNANGSSSRPIPMWGESETTFAIERDKYISVLMHRMLARVDLKVDASVNNFKIKSIRVYRTMNKAYVATSTEWMTGNEVTTPNIPSTAIYNPGDPDIEGYDDIDEADKYPLTYSIATPEGGSSYTHEIYIPESGAYDSSTGTGKMDKVPCLVIGGYYGNSTTETFYRADFAEYEKSKVKAYKQILRNHRYVFNIKSVSNHGFEKPEEALKAIPTDMILDVQAWNEVRLDFYTQGEYFFSIESRDIELEARTKDETVMPSQTTTYKTNLKLNASNVSYTWKNSGNMESDHFDVDIDYNKGTITFTAKQNNIGKDGQPAQELVDELILMADKMEIPIRVKQKAINVIYKLLCERTVVKGKYRENSPLNYTHYLEVQIQSEKPLHTGAEELKPLIEIVSETRKGIYFEYKGKIDNEGKLENGNYVYTLKMQGHGTPVKDPNDRVEESRDDKDFLNPIEDMIITTNSIDGSSCTTRIIFAYKFKKILTIGANAIYRYGYVLEPNSGSRAFVDASINFGIDPNSAVNMEQNKENNAFSIEYMSVSNGEMSLEERIDLAKLQAHLNDFEPDIILTGQAIRFQTADINLIAEFVEKGGVLLMFNEYYPDAESINSMVSAILGKGLSGNKNEAMKRDNLCFTLPGTKGSEDEWKDDPFLNGPFNNDLRGSLWGADGYFMHGFSQIDEDDPGITVYNRRKIDGSPCFFRYDGPDKDEKRAFVFIGDGGFISNSKRYIGATYTGMYDYCPFAINSAYQPIPRTNFMYREGLPPLIPKIDAQTVRNSQLFGNILAWAVDFAEKYGINSRP